MSHSEGILEVRSACFAAAISCHGFVISLVIISLAVWETVIVKEME